MRIEYLDAALADLDNITDYYALTFTVESAYKVYEQIRGSIVRLADYLYSGVPSKDELLRKLGYKELYSGRFVVIYRVEPQDNKIFIYHIADTQTDYPKSFNNLKIDNK
ncbi:MAG: type II toxin-antitoxin system RelE/ParE family toxin [Paenibacillaceae bacterium]|nr:type II toxin-antitoxin system RelE/ParE family toxin [Paenibacillaceae bacterium]